MFRDSEGAKYANTAARRAEAARYPKGIHVIFNSKAYANRENLKQWARQQYKWYGPFSPSNNESRLLALEAFAAHKKNIDELKAQEDFVAELKKLNCTISMASAGPTSYV